MSLFPSNGQFGGIGSNPNSFGMFGGSGGNKMFGQSKWWGGNRDVPQTSWVPGEYASGGGRFGTGGPQQSWGAGMSTKNASQDPWRHVESLPQDPWRHVVSLNVPSDPIADLITVPSDPGWNYGTQGWPQGTGGGGGGGGGGVGGGYNWDISDLLGLLGETELPDEWGGYDYNVPGAWNPDSYNIPELRTDPWEVINASLPWLDEQRQAGYSGAAARMGKTGMLSSTPYAQALGQVERKAQDDLARLTQGNLYDASKFNAQMEQTQRENALNRALQGWQTHGGWDVGLQQQAGNQDFGAWDQMGDWQMSGQMNDQNNLMGLLQMFMPYIMGGG
jgi:hypothetical protein